MRLHSEAEAGIQVLVYPTGTDPEDMLKSEDAATDADESGDSGEDEGEH